MCDSIRDSMHCVTACHGPTYFTEVSRKSFAIPECVLAPLMVENRWDDGAVQLAECTVMLNFPNEQRKCLKKTKLYRESTQCQGDETFAEQFALRHARCSVSCGRTRIF